MQKSKLIEQVVAKTHTHAGGVRQPGDVIYVHKHAAKANETSGRAVDPKDAHKVRAIRESDYVFTLRDEKEKRRVNEYIKEIREDDPDPLDDLEGAELAEYALDSEDFRTMQAACARLDLGGKGSTDELKVKLGGYLQEQAGEPKGSGDE